MANIIQMKRFTKEKEILINEPLHFSTAYQDKTDPLTWYCLIIGQKGTPYYGGQYIYKVVHSPKYPAEPPDYYFLTPSGRYEVDKKICLSNSSYHRGEWSATWNINTILISFYSIFLDNKEHGISHITNERWSSEVCEKLAKESIAYNKKYLASILEGFNFTHLKDDEPKKVIETKPSEQIKPVEEVKVIETKGDEQVKDNEAHAIEEAKPVKKKNKKEKDVDIEEEIVIKEEKKTKMKKMVDGIKEVIKPTKNKK